MPNGIYTCAFVDMGHYVQAQRIVRYCRLERVCVCGDDTVSKRTEL